MARPALLPRPAVHPEAATWVVSSDRRAVLRPGDPGCIGQQLVELGPQLTRQPQDDLEGWIGGIAVRQVTALELLVVIPSDAGAMGQILLTEPTG